MGKAIGNDKMNKFVKKHIPVFSDLEGHVLVTGGELSLQIERTCPPNQLKIILELSRMNTSVNE